MLHPHPMEQQCKTTESPSPPSWLVMPHSSPHARRTLRAAPLHGWSANRERRQHCQHGLGGPGPHLFGRHRLAAAGRDGLLNAEDPADRGMTDLGHRCVVWVSVVLLFGVVMMLAAEGVAP